LEKKRAAAEAAPAEQKRMPPQLAAGPSVNPDCEKLLPARGRGEGGDASGWQHGYGVAASPVARSPTDGGGDARPGPGPQAGPVGRQ